MIMKLIYNLV